MTDSETTVADLIVYLDQDPETFTRRFSDAVYSQVCAGGLEGEGEELVELFANLTIDPWGNRFLSFLLGMDPNSWLQEYYVSQQEDEEEEE